MEGNNRRMRETEREIEREREREREVYIESIKKNFYGTIFNMIRASRCRRSWRAAVIDVARGRIRLDGTG